MNELFTNNKEGLTGSVEIKTGTRSVMKYFLEPVIDGFGNSMKEK